MTTNILPIASRLGARSGTTEPRPPAPERREPSPAGAATHAGLAPPTPIRATPESSPAGAAAPAAGGPNRLDRRRLNELKAQVQRRLVDAVNPDTDLRDGGMQVRGQIE